MEPKLGSIRLKGCPAMPGIRWQVIALLVPALSFATLLAMIQSPLPQLPRVIAAVGFLISLYLPIQCFIRARRIRLLRASAQNRLDKIVQGRRLRDAFSVARLLAISSGWPHESRIDLSNLKEIEDRLQIRLPRLWVFKSKQSKERKRWAIRTVHVHEISSDSRPKNARLLSRIGGLLIAVSLGIFMYCNFIGHHVPFWGSVLGAVPGLVCMIAGSVTILPPSRIVVSSDVISFESGDKKERHGNKLNPEKTLVWIKPDRGILEWTFICIEPPFCASSVFPELNDVPWILDAETAEMIGVPRN